MPTRSGRSLTCTDAPPAICEPEHTNAPPCGRRGVRACCLNSPAPANTPLEVQRDSTCCRAFGATPRDRVTITPKV
jgi:hypothetical protein